MSNSTSTNEIEALPAERIHFLRQDEGVLSLSLDGQVVALAPPRRMLPLSEPEHFIALYDMNGNELGMIEDVADLPPASATVLQEALAENYVLERIVRILEVEKEPLTGRVRWRVQIEGNGSEPVAESASSTHHARDEADGSAAPGHDGSGDGSKTGGARAILEQNVLDVASQLLTRTKDQGSSSATGQEREFYISGQEDVQTARFPHIYVVDTERNRYEIPDWEALDLDSRHAAEQFL